MARVLYRVFTYFGLASVFGAMLYGFRYDAHAPAVNYFGNVAMFALWAALHLVMTRSWFKEAVYGSPAGSGLERQVFVSIAVITWLVLLWYHLPVPGGSPSLPGPVRFAGTVGFLLCVMAFFEGVTFPMLDGLLGVPGSSVTHSHGAETPLLTGGQYARVRHPMYRAALLGALCSIVIHTNAAQVLWCVLIGATFVGFIPIEERQLIEARGDAYRAYMQATPWRLFRGVW